MQRAQVLKNHEDTKAKLETEIASNKAQQAVAMAEFVKTGNIFQKKAEDEGLTLAEAVEVGYF